MNQSELIRRFTRDGGATKGQASNMFIDGDILYSYGHHFPLLVRMKHWGKDKFMLNADKYSVTTSQHQSACWKHATIVIPFSALESALGGLGGDRLEILDKVRLIDKAEARKDLIGYNRYDSAIGKDNRISIKEYEGLTEIGQNQCFPVYERRPESCVLMYKGKRYLSSMDEGGYFISLLPRETINTVEEAFKALMPEYMRGKEYKRQGEWFFVPTRQFSPPENLIKKYVTLKSTVTPTGHHFVRDYFKSGFKQVYARGTVRHANGDHRMLKLGEVWHMVQESRHRGSWTASGNVD